MRTKPILLEVRDLVVQYGRIHALHGISLQVREGELVTLLGSNGAGKTTTMRAISGLLPLTSGSVWFEGATSPGSRPTSGPRKAWCRRRRAAACFRA